MPRLKSDNETRTERISLVLRQSTRNSIKQIATMQQRSLNDLIEEILKNYISKHSKELKDYANTFKDNHEN